MINSRTPSSANSCASRTISMGLVTCFPRMDGIAQKVQAGRNLRKSSDRRSARRHSQSLLIGADACTGAGERGTLFIQMAHQPIGHLGDFIAAKHSDQRIDVRPQDSRSSCCRSAGNRPQSHRASCPAASDPAFPRSPKGLPRACSMKPQVLTITKSVPSGRSPVCSRPIAAAQHSFAVNKVLRAPKLMKAYEPLVPGCGFWAEEMLKDVLAMLETGCSPFEWGASTLVVN